jgi:uncharacterized membrane protein
MARGLRMATLVQSKPLKSLAPDLLEIALGWLSLVLLAVVIVALLRGFAHWPEVPWTVWVHLGTMMTALAITPAILWHPRGTMRHRVLGYTWVACLFVTAALSFWIRVSHPGHLSFIHILSAWTLVILPVIVFAARSGNVVRHRRSVRGMVIGALLIAGFFTLPPFRMLGEWLFGLR